MSGRPIHFILNRFFLTPSDFDFGFGQQPFIEAGCKVSNCFTTNDRSLLHQSDAVLFDALNYDHSDLPQQRWPHQRYIYVHHEALPSTNPVKVNYDIFRLGKPHYFNWTMTHRRDSDILSLQPTGMLIRKSPYPPQVDQLPIKLPPGQIPSFHIPPMHPLAAANKTKLMIYFASNCNTSSRREEYFNVLSKHIPVDTFGYCGENTCQPWNGEKCFKDKLPSYKFMLSSENSLCPDWIAQRFYRALKYGAVPVVYGVADYSAYAPSHSYIHTADFASPQDLADYLLLLDRNDALYAKYFEWRNDWEVDRKPMIGWCELCNKLNDQMMSTKTYANLSKWWFEDGPCYPTEDFLDRLLPSRRGPFLSKHIS